MIYDKQVWESDSYIIKIEKVEDNYHGVIYKKIDDDLKLIEILIQEHDKDFHRPIEKLIKRMNFQLTNKTFKVS